MRINRIWTAVFTVIIAAGVARAAEDAKVELKDTPGDHLDVLVGGKVAARYMYAYDKSTPERLAETYKPYLHVFDAEGKTTITKGGGGEFPHHHGIFIGWNKITGADGKAYDRWHMKGGDIIHQKFTEQNADGNSATFTAVNQWDDGTGKPILMEERTTTVKPGTDGVRLVIDCTFRLENPGNAGDVILDGDPEHAGVHFRPADDVDRLKTAYMYPAKYPKPHEDKDYPWVGVVFTLKDTGKSYGVFEINHPSNPKGTRWSAYRNYGRFGAFPKITLSPGKPVTLKYRFLVGDNTYPVVPLKSYWDEFSGAPNGPIEVSTELPAEQPAPTPAAAPKK